MAHKKKLQIATSAYVKLRAYFAAVVSNEDRAKRINQETL
jgi:hypothetical protein